MVGIMVVVIVAVMTIVMKHEVGHRIKPAAQVGRRGEMDWNVIEVEGEQARHKQTTPPTRRLRRGATSVMSVQCHGELTYVIG